MTSSSSQDKKIGRDAAQTIGRTTGGYKPKTAKWSKRRGSKGARRVAKQKLHRSSIGENINTIFEGGTIMVKQSFLDSLKKTHPEDHARLMKKFKGQKKDVIGTKDSYPKPVKEEKMSGQEYSSYMKKVKSKDPEVKKAVGQV